jgi:DNA repair protein RecO (recombination protein O)
MPKRERSIRTEAVVLRHSDWGEADRLLYLYTEHLGKVRAIGKGIRKPRSRKSGHLEPFTHTNLQLARGRDLYIVTQAETINAFLPLRDDLILFGQASYAIELVDRFTFEGEENQAIFRLIIRTLSRLAVDKDCQLVLRYFEMRLLDLLGFRPQLQRCTACEAQIKPEDQYFSSEKGGVMCPRCGANIPGARPVSMSVLKFMRHFQRSSYEQARLANPGSALHTQIEILMQHYLTYLLERNLNSPAFLRKMHSELQTFAEDPSHQPKTEK